MTTRRAVLLGLAGAVPALALAPGGARADGAVAYAAIRVVRAVPGEPEEPEIVLPAGYSLTAGAQYRAVSRAECVAFVQGPAAGGVPVTVRWPGQRIRAVVADDRRLAMGIAEGDPDAVAVTVPVLRSSPAADSPTLQIWTRLSAIESGVNWLIAHNDPDRAAGPWATGAFPSAAARSVLTFGAAAEAILRDSGLAATAAGRGHFFQLEGFETNNPLHPDNPPHWHLSYYPGATVLARPATVPHFWVDGAGRTFYNGQDVTGQGRTKYYPGDPAPIRDGTGATILTTRIRGDGGLDVTVPYGPSYSVTAADFTGPLDVLRNGARWRTIAVEDRVADGVLRIDAGAARTEYEYDSLTGVLVQQRPY